MHGNQTNQHHIVVDEKIDKANLRRLAIKLEVELLNLNTQSEQLAALAKLEPLLSAIKRSKNLEIEIPEELPNLMYWRLHTDLQKYSSLSQALSEFELSLKCWRIVLN